MATEEPYISCTEPSEEEVLEALLKLKNGKAPAICNIAIEMFEARGPALLRWLTVLVQDVWNIGSISDNWLEGINLIFVEWHKTAWRDLAFVKAREVARSAKTTAESHCYHALENSSACPTGQGEDKLISARRKEQSSFTPGHLTINQISALHKIIHGRR